MRIVCGSHKSSLEQLNSKTNDKNYRKLLMKQKSQNQINVKSKNKLNHFHEPLYYHKQFNLNGNRPLSLFAPWWIRYECYSGPWQCHDAVVKSQAANSLELNSEWMKQRKFSTLKIIFDKNECISNLELQFLPPLIANTVSSMHYVLKLSDFWHLRYHTCGWWEDV